jgi:hypothetical protein
MDIQFRGFDQETVFPAGGFNWGLLCPAWGGMRDIREKHPREIYLPIVGPGPTYTFRTGICGLPERVRGISGREEGKIFRIRFWKK